LAWWVIKSRGLVDALVHARKQIMADGVDVTECLARVCSRRRPASGRGPIKRVEHPFPQPTSPKNVFPKVFQMKKKKKKKKKKGFFVLMFGWLAGSNVPPFDVSSSQKNASPKNNSMYGFDVWLAWWVIKSRGWR
jgi:hypothetical protein